MIVKPYHYTIYLSFINSIIKLNFWFLFWSYD